MRRINKLISSLTISTGWLICTQSTIGAEPPSLGIDQPATGIGLPQPNIDITKWPRMTSKDFGCYMEKTFGYRDKRFNCSLKRSENKGDPCHNAETYYEGPEFPSSLIAKVHPLANDITLEWEHGELRAVSLHLKGAWNEAEVRKAFHLPRAEAAELTLSEREATPDNLMYTSVQYNSEDIDSRVSDPSRGHTSIILQGFDHMGAGDVECGVGG